MIGTVRIEEHRAEILEVFGPEVLARAERSNAPSWLEFMREENLFWGTKHELAAESTGAATVSSRRSVQAMERVESREEVEGS